MYNIVRNRPVAQFYYKGTKKAPVRRTVLITEQDKETIKGYEVREGSQVRDVEDAPIKTFRLDKVATTSQLRSDNPLRNKKDQSTYTRMSLTEAETVGF